MCVILQSCRGTSSEALLRSMKEDIFKLLHGTPFKVVIFHEVSFMYNYREMAAMKSTYLDFCVWICNGVLFITECMCMLIAQ